MSVAPSEHRWAVPPAPPGFVGRERRAVPLLDVSRQNQPLRDEIAGAIMRVCDSGRFVLGPECEDLEHRVAEYCGTGNAVGCASGSDALLLALMAYGVGPGDEVLMPSYTFFATASAAWRLGALPVFVDIDPKTFNMDPAGVEVLISPRTKAIIPVHLFGQCADMTALETISRAHGIPLVEDACQAIGAQFAGRRAGSFGVAGCISFYPTKNLGGFGDGGMITTNDVALADQLRLLRGHGMRPRYHHSIVGINSRLDTLQAAVLDVKLSYLDQWNAARQANAQRYAELFAAHRLDQIIGLPAVGAGRRHVWNQYVIRVPDGRRDALRAHLAERQIGTEIYYPVPLHRQACFAALGYGPGSLPETERAAEETLALPIFAELTAAEQETVVRQIGAFLRQSRNAA